MERVEEEERVLGLWFLAGVDAGAGRNLAATAAAAKGDGSGGGRGGIVVEDRAAASTVDLLNPTVQIARIHDTVLSGLPHYTSRR